jgi:hypothetical protein
MEDNLSAPVAIDVLLKSVNVTRNNDGTKNYLYTAGFYGKDRASEIWLNSNYQ